MSFSPWAIAAAGRATVYRLGLLRRHRLPAATVSIGALEMGGTGKTPATAAVAALLRDAGRRVAIVSRGYGRQDREPRLVGTGSGPLVEASLSGDEPGWYARTLAGVAVAVAARRERAAPLLAAFAPDVFVLDDAFQHLRLERDVDLLVVDGDAPFWRASPPPTGRLREGIGGAARADAFLVVGPRAAEGERWLARRFPGRPVFGMAREYPGAVTFDGWLRGEAAIQEPREVLLFSGIARPERFAEAAGRAGWRVVAQQRFRDHHWYGAADLDRLRRLARDAGASALLTTEKDAVRLAGLQSAAGDLLVFPMRLRPQAPAELLAWLQRRLSKRATP